jgi:hypothetical protein
MQAYAQPAAASTAPAAAPKAPHRKNSVAQFMRSKSALKQAFILSEVLNKPIAMREEG